MPYSFAKTTQVACQHCEHHFAANVCFVVDIGERPDLAQRIFDETLNLFCCPNCDQLMQSRAPLLIWSAERTKLELSPETERNITPATTSMLCPSCGAPMV
jgi:predicted RNA-binding Zn-ribbon protein involved in translation (DUF1610 family)